MKHYKDLNELVARLQRLGAEIILVENDVRVDRTNLSGKAYEPYPYQATAVHYVSKTHYSSGTGGVVLWKR